LIIGVDVVFNVDIDVVMRVVYSAVNNLSSSLRNGTVKEKVVTMDDGAKVTVPFNKEFSEFTKWTKSGNDTSREVM